MTEREELSRIVRREYTRAIDRKRVADCFDAPADAILAAGYTKRRTVATVEELDALPNGALLLSGDRIRRYAGVVWRISDGMVTRVGKELNGVTPARYFKDPLPVTVIYTPEPQP